MPNGNAHVPFEFDLKFTVTPPGNGDPLVDPVVDMFELPNPALDGLQMAEDKVLSAIGEMVLDVEPPPPPINGLVNGTDGGDLLL